VLDLNVMMNHNFILLLQTSKIYQFIHSAVTANNLNRLIRGPRLMHGTSNALEQRKHSTCTKEGYENSVLLFYRQLSILPAKILKIDML
jgi:hypothetical protein